MDRTFHAKCRGCGDRSPDFSLPELIERWTVEHVAAWHPEHLSDIRRRLVRGTQRVRPDGGQIAASREIVRDDVDLEAMVRL